MCGRARVKEEGRREGEGVGQQEEREGSRSVQSRKMGWEKGEGAGSAWCPDHDAHKITQGPILDH